MVLVLVTLLAGLLIITAFFYGGQMVLHWLEMPDSPQALGSFVGQAGSKSAVARPPGAEQALSESGLGLVEPIIGLGSAERL